MTDWAMSDKTHVTETNPAGLVRTDPRPDSEGYKLIRLENALVQAAMSLETIADQAGRDESLKHMTQVRGYAHSRATVARAALEGK